MSAEREQILLDLVKRVRFEGADFSKLGRDGQFPKTEAEVTAFIRERTRLYVDSWVIPKIEQLLEHERQSTPAMAGRRLMCPYAGYAYREVPGYREGYGCPVCKAISVHGHLLLTEPVVVPRSLGSDEGAYRTALHKGVNGCGQAVRWHLDDVVTDVENDRRYFTCPCGKPFTLAIGLTQSQKDQARRPGAAEA